MIIFYIFIIIISIYCIFKGLQAMVSNDTSYYSNQQTHSEFIRQADKHMAELVREQKLYEAYMREPIVKEHNRNIEKIEEQYSVLYNLKQLESANADKLIKLCERDIQICQEFCNLNKKYETGITVTYPTFKRLAIILEKRKEYEKAAQVCATAIKLGFNDDGTAGKMHGRLARMIRLSGNSRPAEYYLEHKN